MFVHLVPRLYSKAEKCELIDFSSEELNIRLINNYQLIVKRPYPNKDYLVACKNNEKNITGILVKTAMSISSFTTLTRWKVNGHLITHKISYEVLDKRFLGVSECMSLWEGIAAYIGNLDKQTAGQGKRLSPILTQPCMEFDTDYRWGPLIFDTRNKNGFIENRLEKFSMPTISPDKIFQSSSHNELANCLYKPKAKYLEMA